MTAALLASSSAFANPAAVLITLLATLLLLALHAWCQTMEIALSRQVLHLLDWAILALTVLFVALVAVRFVTIG